VKEWRIPMVMQPGSKHGFFMFLFRSSIQSGFSFGISYHFAWDDLPNPSESHGGPDGPQGFFEVLERSLALRLRLLDSFGGCAGDHEKGNEGYG